MKRKLLSILALLLMATTGAWAQADQPLTLEARKDGVTVTMQDLDGTYKKISPEGTEESGDIWDVENKITLNEGDILQLYYDETGDFQIQCSDGGCYIYGNIMSLAYKEEYEGKTDLNEKSFKGLFSGNANLYNHPTKALVLPATTLTEECYKEMFKECTNLTIAPKLPAMVLAERCYECMFDGCTSLTTAPKLPAETLVNDCYYHMFDGCTNLNTVTCLATDISANNSTISWLSGVSYEEGKFLGVSSTQWWRDDNGIPSSWETVDYEEIELTDDESLLDVLNDNADKTIWVNYTRTFTAGKPSTVCLPFAYVPKAGEKFYTFAGITKEDGNYIANMMEEDGTRLSANTPYLYVPSETGITYFSGTYAIGDNFDANDTEDGDWIFRGTYRGEEWYDEPTGIYGFSAQDANDGITQGQFVKVGEYVRIKPMGCYLMYKYGDEDYAEARVRTPRNAAKEETLPETISVRLISADGVVTGIGSLHADTGEVTLDDAAWYSLDGTRFSSKPTRKDIYINNGKKIVVK